MHYLEDCTQLGKWKDLSPVGFWAIAPVGVEQSKG